MAADDQEYYGYYYDTEEDRGLLDPAWERQQKKVVSSIYSDTVKWLHDWFAVLFNFIHGIFSYSQKLNVLTTVCFAYLLRRLLQHGVILI